MRTKGHKCYNIKCGACVGKTLCGLSGDEALTCDSRMVNQKTNAQSIRAMSDEELAEFMCDNDNSWVTSMGRQLRYDNYLEWLKSPVEEDA